MILLDEPADAVKFSVKPQRADMIQTTQHRRPATPRVRYRIVFFIERLIDKSIRISARRIRSCLFDAHALVVCRITKRHVSREPGAYGCLQDARHTTTARS